MSDDNFSTRKVSADEMVRLQELLAKVEALADVKIEITPELYARVDAVLSLCDVEAGSEDERFRAAVREIFETGLQTYEARLDSDE